KSIKSMMMTKHKIFLFILLLPIFIYYSCLSHSQPEYKKIEKARWEYIKGDDEKYYKILEAFKKGDEYSGYAALILGKLRDQRATQALCSELLSNGTYAKESLTALGLILDQRSVPILIRVVKEDRLYAKEAIELLGKLKDKRAVPTLIQVIKDRKPYYLSAFDALGEIGDDRVLPYLLEFLEKPVQEEPQNLKLRVIHRGKDDPSWEYTRTFQYTGRNIPPRVEIVDYRTNPIGVAWIHYQLYDDDLDTLNIIPEFSLDGGNSWTKANVEGITENITSELYDGELYWRADKENIEYSPLIKVVFKLTPLEKKSITPNGIQDAINIETKYNEIDLKDIYVESRGNITFSLYYPGIIPETENVFKYMYSLNNGKNWIPATAQRLILTEIAAPDTEKVIWKSEEDLPEFDSDNVSFLVSLGGGKALGKWDFTAPFHLDNNKEPSVKILSINDAELLEIEYQIYDAEGDTIGLIPEFSRDEGVTWEQATISGDISKLTPTNYHGILKWYSTFDITQLQDKLVRIRLTPYDNDQGTADETKDFFLKPSYYAKPVSGLSKNDISLKYYNTKSDSTVPIVQLSTDGGKRWRNATAKSIPGTHDQDRYLNIINWEADEDVVLSKKRINIFSKVFNQLKDPSIVPELLLISRQKDSPSYLERRNAIQAIEILNQKPNWAIEGALNSLLDESAIVRDLAQNYLRPVDEPRIQDALRSYDNYWNEKYRAEKEESASEKESIYYAQEIEKLKTYKPTKSEVTDFIKDQFVAQGLRENIAEEFVNQLELFKIEKRLKAQLNNGIITKDEYDRTLKEEIRKFELAKLKSK
ncbi:HEAT repeat domain-containing protein, partial [candidate division KSB1 bacterium]